MVYIRRTPGSKHDQIARWGLPDRVFFAAGACHILAYAFLDRFPEAGGRAFWIKPLDGSPTNHVFVDLGDCAFDYHGYTSISALLDHFGRRARQIWPTWKAELVEIPKDVLISEARSKTYAGLWLREPRQFLHDALPRACTYLDRFQHPLQRARLTHRTT
ncbi:MAG TPA: hypothetical protein PKW21_04225 [Rhabdaerophilum sp.]|nr:hypothetical protein [Rhabdaerophilum sp.]